ncbi:MAG: hypothetical protein R6W06_05970, partial [Prochlorococcaceae cyanobacterium]
DEDARDLGVQVINTAQASGGFREILKLHVPSALEVVRRDEGSKAAEASSNAFTIAEAMVASDGRRQWIEQQGGVRHVAACLDFAVWFCQQLVNSCADQQMPVTGTLTLNASQPRALYAHWSASNVLTLALDQGCFWQEPFGAESLKVLIHEAAHAMNMHHGYEFRTEVERLAGVAASLMLLQGHQIHRTFPQLVERLQPLAA